MLNDINHIDLLWFRVITGHGACVCVAEVGVADVCAPCVDVVCVLR